MCNVWDALNPIIDSVSEHNELLWCQDEWETFGGSVHWEVLTGAGNRHEGFFSLQGFPAVRPCWSGRAFRMIELNRLSAQTLKLRKV